MRNEDYDRELLVGVTLICAAVIGVLSLLNTTQPPSAKQTEQTAMRVEQLAPVRIVGTPFVLNTDPSVRLARD
jgi:hypothetical protein